MYQVLLKLPPRQQYKYDNTFARKQKSSQLASKCDGDDRMGAKRKVI